MVASPQAFTAIDKTAFDDRHDIATRMISMERPHRAVPLASALCLAVACRIEGTLPNMLARKTDAGSPIRVGNPSGVLSFGADVRNDGGWVADSAGVYRTARCLMKGVVSAPLRKVRMTARGAPASPRGRSCLRSRLMRGYGGVISLEASMRPGSSGQHARPG